MTVTTTVGPSAITSAAEVAGLTITTLRQIAGNDYMVTLTGESRDQVLAFCRALIAADPGAVAMVGKARMDAARLQSLAG